MCFGVRVVVLHQVGQVRLSDKVSLAAAEHKVKQISRSYLTSVGSVDPTECCVGFKLHLSAQLLPLLFNCILTLRDIKEVSGEGRLDYRWDSIVVVESLVFGWRAHVFCLH